MDWVEVGLEGGMDGGDGGVVGVGEVGGVIVWVKVEGVIVGFGV